MAYDEVIADPGVADARLVMAWAHASGRLNPKTRKYTDLNQKVLDDFADSHGLPSGYYTLKRKGSEHLLQDHPERAPGGVNPGAVAAQRIRPPAGWGRVFTAAAYQEVIDLPGLADPLLVAAWAHETGRLSRLDIARVTPGVVNDFATAHGLPAGSYTLIYSGEGSVYSPKSYRLQSNPDLFPGGADPNSAAPIRIRPPDGWGRNYERLAYDEVIDNPEVADVKLLVRWARATGRLPASGTIDKVGRDMLVDFAADHGLPPASYTLTYDGRGSAVSTKSYRLRAHRENFPNGADRAWAAAKRMQFSLAGEKPYAPAAYLDVIFSPGIVDGRLALAWARETGRLADPKSGLANLRQGVLNDFATAHGLPNGYYTLAKVGREYFVESHPDRAPYGADMTQAAAQKIPLPAGWVRTFTPAAYQEVIDNPCIVDDRLLQAWARDTGRLAHATSSNMTVAVLNDFTDAHGLPRGSYTLPREGGNCFLQSHPDRFPYGANPEQAAAARISLPAGWRPGVPAEARQHDQVLDPLGNRLPAPGAPALAYSAPSGQYAADPAPQGDYAQNPYEFASSAQFQYAGPGPAGPDLRYPSVNPYAVEAQPPLALQRSHPSHDVSRYTSDYGTSASYGFNQPTTDASRYTGYSDSGGPNPSSAGPSLSNYHDYARVVSAPNYQYGSSSVNQEAISYTTQQMDSMSITTNSWQHDVAGVQSSARPANQQADYSFDEVQPPTPEQGRRKHRRRR
ncbi:hypothetical protein [Micromonospora sp. NPDC049107]|uniref:hypothetical protein n=1 Tax=Micromonospora sp. NPDC049107 TaxID=3154349 RepID=UPI0033DD6387